MADKIIMPKQGLQMTRGTITSWLKNEGDEITLGEPLFEIETDKLAITIDSIAEGSLLKILHPAGDIVPITEIIAWVGKPGEAITADVTPPPPNKPSDHNYDFDAAILGGGPGGYEAAIRCAQLGLKTILIEADKLGGTCLNRGCIPTKALLHCANIFQLAQQASKLGIYMETVTYDYAACAKYKDTITDRLRRGIETLEHAHGVTIEKGFGILKDQHTIEISESKKITSQNIILAVGSAPARPPIKGIEGENILTSDEILLFKKLPESILIVGGGAIGIEFAALFANFCKKVTILEMMPTLLSGMDKQIVEMMTAHLEEKGIQIYSNVKVTTLQGGAAISAEYIRDGVTSTVTADCCLISAGRTAQTSGLGLEAIGVNMNQGFIEVDENMRTSVPNIYAIGDITGKIQLAHAASAQGLCAASCCAGMIQKMRYDMIPSCIYTEPELASVGLTEEKARENGRQINIGTFSISGNGKAMILGESNGIAKIISDQQTGEILGAQLMAPRAADMIGEIVAVMRCEGTIEELGDTIHPHPSISEIILEAAHDIEKLSCNKLPCK